MLTTVWITSAVSYDKLYRCIIADAAINTLSTIHCWVCINHSEYNLLVQCFVSLSMSELAMAIN